MTAASVCRVCLESKEAGRDLSVFAKNSKIALKIFLISGIQVVGTKEHPALICLQCVKELNHADLFRKKCLEGDEYFRTVGVVSGKLIDDQEIKNCYDDKCFEISNTEQHGSRHQELNPRNDCIDYSINESTKGSTRKGNKNKTSSNRKAKIKEQFFCSKCFKGFSDEGYLKKHEYFRHFEIPIENLLECDFCGHRTKTKQLIKNHINTVHSSKPKIKFICRICGNMLSTKGNLDNHEKTHLQVDPSDYVTCPVCKKAFREKRFMTEHRKLVHDKTKAFQCPHCPHISTCKGAYNKHFKSVHLKLRDFICTDCGLGFSTNSQLTRHFRIHTGERPYECKTCSKPFRLSSHRKRHEEICTKRLPDQ